MTMLASWKLDPYTVMRLNGGRRGDDVLKRGYLVCSSHKPLTSSYSPVAKRLQAGQDQGFCIVYPAKYFESFPRTDSINSSRYKGIAAQTGEVYSTMDLTILQLDVLFGTRLEQTEMGPYHTWNL